MGSHSTSGFPLFKHATGTWCKKVKGKHHYFGRIAEDPDGQQALALWLEQRDELLAGRVPKAKWGQVTVRDVLERFLQAKLRQLESGELKARSFGDYKQTCDAVAVAFGWDRPVEDLAAEDFEKLRASSAKRLGARGPGGGRPEGSELLQVRLRGWSHRPACQDGPGIKAAVAAYHQAGEGGQGSSHVPAAGDPCLAGGSEAATPSDDSARHQLRLWQLGLQSPAHSCPGLGGRLGVVPTSEDRDPEALSALA
jgi:hypothetical protein